MSKEESFVIFGREIFINSRTGKFSFSEDIFNEQLVLNTNNYIKSFQPKFINICLCISNNCNLKCDYCFNNKKDEKRMTSEQAKKIIEKMIDAFPTCDKYYVDLSGNGEPLLNLNCIMEISNYCIEKSNLIRKEILVSFVSNGILLSETIVKKIQNAGILFGISIDGNKHTHDLHRKTINNKKTYELILNNVKNIEHKEFLGCAVTITNEVFDILKTIKNLSLYFSTISIKPVRDIFLGINSKSLIGWIKQYERLTLKIIKDLKSKDISILKKLLNGDDFFGKFINRAIMETITINRCDSRITRFTFDCSGKIYGCPPATIYNDLECTNFDSKVELSKQIDRNSSCKQCQYYLFCGGECEIETYLHKSKNKQMCLFKTKLIQFALFIKLYTQKDFPDIYRELKKFCIEKSKRNSLNEELESFLLNNPKDSFVEAKNKFYNSKKENI